MKMLIINFKLILWILMISCTTSDNINLKNRGIDTRKDLETLSKLNAQFIKNFITQDVEAHSKIIHPDFVCIENNGNIIGREAYLKNWATDFQNSGLDTFTYMDEVIRIFGSTALVRSKSVFTKKIEGQLKTGYSVYTDTYIKENGRWRCVQAHMTPVK